MRSSRSGPAYDKASQLGPVVTAEHRKFVTDWISKGVEEGAELVLDGRGVVVPGYENGFYVGPTLFDHVRPGMTHGRPGDLRPGAAASSGSRTSKKAWRS